MLIAGDELTRVSICLFVLGPIVLLELRNAKNIKWHRELVQTPDLVNNSKAIGLPYLPDR